MYVLQIDYGNNKWEELFNPFTFEKKRMKFSSPKTAIDWVTYHMPKENWKTALGSAIQAYNIG